MPAASAWIGECYYHNKLNPNIQPLLVMESSQLDAPKKNEYPGDRVGNALPLAWYHTFDGGRPFYTGLGHNQEQNANASLRKRIQGGILWAMGVAE